MVSLKPSDRPLSITEARVLGVLMEKARTVPDSYPLSVNSLTLGCNQKTSRDPVMELTEADVQAALESLKLNSLIFENSGSRVMRYSHNFQRVYGVGEQHAVLLGLMMLRGPQTPAELRINGERWYKFADNSSVEAFLRELCEWDEASQVGRHPDKGEPLVKLLPRAPGAREQRWAHLIAGAVVTPSFAALSPLPDDAPSSDELLALRDRIDQLEVRLAALEAKLGGAASAAVAIAVADAEPAALSA
jgi:uncharacterized protein